MAVLAAALLVSFTIQPAAADTINVMWNPSPPEEDVAGYRVLVGTQQGVYSEVFDAGSQTFFAYTTAVPGQRYFFAVAAYDDLGAVGPAATISGFSNETPTLTASADQTTVIAEPVSLQLVGTDPDGLPVTYSAVGLPPGLTVHPVTGLISGTPTKGGIFAVTVTVSDGVLTISRMFEWFITGAPTITISSPTAAPTFTAGTSILFISGSAGDDAGISSVTWASNRGGSGTATGTSSWSFWLVNIQPGNNVVTVTARNLSGITSTDTLTVVYGNGDVVAPVMAITSPTVSGSYFTDLATISMSGTATDDVAVTSVTWVNSRGGSGSASLGAGTWTIASVPLQPGANVITVTAQDGGANAANATLTVTLNSAPVVTNPGAQTTTIGTAVNLPINATDADADSISWSATGLPAGLSINPLIGVISGTPTAPGTFSVVVTASDGAASGDASFNWSVSPVAVTPAATVANKAYDGTTAATVSSCTVSGVLGGHVVACTGTATFDTAAVGVGKAVTVNGLTLSGADAAKYVLTTTTTTTTATITARTVTAAATAADKAYDGTTAATLTGCTVTGALAGDVLGCTGMATFATADPGAGKTVTVTGLTLTGAAAGNYVLATPSVTTTASIVELNVAPLASTPTAPIGETASTAPTFTWAATPNVGYYLLSVDDAAPGVIERWYTPAQAGCAASSTCSVAVSATLAPGLVRWNVLTWNSYGYGPWSATATVVVDLADPATLAPSAGTPAGPIGTRTPTFAWTALANATWYQLEVTDSTATVRESWFTPTEACVATSCSVSPNVVLSIGPAQWRLRAWSATGAGQWTAPVAFETAGSAPGKATLISPAGPVPTTTPTFTWNAVIGTSYYLLRIVDRDDAYIERWYRPSEVGCQLGTGTCTVSPNTTVKAGLATWQILTWNGSGYGPWSAPGQFSVDVTDPSAGVPEPVGPSGTISASNVTYTWTSVAGAIAYRLSIRNNGGPSLEWWYTAAAAGCAAGAQCSVQPGANLASGTAEWMVQAWTTMGHGGWSTPVALVVTVLTPTAPLLVSPVGPTVATPSFVWQASPVASLYYVSAYDSGGRRVDRWLTPAAVDCGSGTGTCTYSPGVTMNSGAGSWQAIAWNPSGYSPWSATNAFVVP